MEEYPATGLLMHTLFYFHLSLFSAAACSDPGIVFLPPKKEVDNEAQLSSLNNTMECGRCNFERPRTATHCYECGVCVDQLDHHCPVSIYELYLLMW